MTHHQTHNAANAAGKPAFDLALESEDQAADIHLLHEKAFGPGRFTRAAFRLREQGPSDPTLSFVALERNTRQLLGSARLTWVTAIKSKSTGLLLGPLAIQPDFQNKGIGRALVAHCIVSAKSTNAQYVMLVGDQPYYGPLGFDTVPRGQIALPGPVDESRLLLCPLNGFEVIAISGLICHADLARG